METTTSNSELGVTTASNETWRHGDPHYFLLITYPIVFLFGVFGNTLVITIVLKYVQPYTDRQHLFWLLSG